MADVRTLLQAERAARRVTHSNAAYSTDGKLHCNLCGTMIKSDAAWQAHLHSTGHTLRISRQLEAAVREPVTVSKKRKAASALEDPTSTADERKRAKPDGVVDVPPGMEGEAERLAGLAAIARGSNAPAPTALARGEMNSPTRESEIQSQSLKSAQSQSLETAQSQLLGETVDEGETAAHEPPAIDDAELAAFERELAAMEASAAATKNSSALNAEATISAAPLTAKEIAAQAREEQSAQRGKRDVEIEAEKEDAANLLHNEFEEMEGLEERLRKLREKREALRTGRAEGEGWGDAAGAVDGEVAADGDAEVDGEEEGEDEEDEDEWGFVGGQ